jgi:adenylate cyclase
MALNERAKLRLRILVIVTLTSALGGGIYGLLRAKFDAVGVAQGMLTGVLIGGPLSVFEIFYWYDSRGEWGRRAPFLASAAIKACVYAAVIMIGLTVGIATFGPAGNPSGSLFWAEFGWGVAFSFAFGFLIQMGLHINRMVGGRTLLMFVAGRYNRPKVEDRVFLFLDMTDSTAIAERIGDLRFMDLLNEFFYDVADAVLECKGEIHKYVGDEVIVTWPLARGVADANCVRCIFSIRDRLAAKGARYQASFGVTPTFRAGLHAGAVVSGEMGDVKQEIGYLGSVMNTTARILEACRGHGRDFLASAEIVGRVALPPAFVVERLGSIALRGRQSEIDLVGIERVGAG